MVLQEALQEQDHGGGSINIFFNGKSDDCSITYSAQGYYNTSSMNGGNRYSFSRKYIK